MQTEINNKVIPSSFEWACRILITINVLLVLSSIIVYFQTDYQLVSPLIPQSVLYDIVRPYFIASFITGIILLISIWFYFFNKKLIVVILQGLGIILYYVAFELLLK